MSANAEVLLHEEAIQSPARESSPVREPQDKAGDWDPEQFAREQIRGLVQRVFLASGPKPVKQVAFSGTDAGIDVASICEQVARALAIETHSHVALVDGQNIAPAERFHPRRVQANKSASIHLRSVQIAPNLWRVPGACEEDNAHERSRTGFRWVARLAELRSEFAYTVILAPVAGTDSEAAVIGQIADGIVLVLGAHITRKATARKIKDTMEASQCRILGTVLSERTFPIPAAIYRRL